MEGVIHIERKNGVIEFPDLIIDDFKHKVCLNGREVVLTLTEYKVLLYLAESPERVFSKEQIFRAVYEEDYVDDISNIIYCQIYSLRKKLQSKMYQKQYIHTVRGVGYKFVV